MGVVFLNRISQLVNHITSHRIFSFAIKLVMMQKKPPNTLKSRKVTNYSVKRMYPGKESFAFLSSQKALW